MNIEEPTEGVSMKQLEVFQAIENAIQIGEQYRKRLANLRGVEEDVREQVAESKTMLMAIELHMKQLREGKKVQSIEEIYAELTT